MSIKSFLPFALLPVIACSFDGRERAALDEAHLGRSVAPRIDTISRIAKEAAMIDGLNARAAATVGGFVQIFDDQLTNTHGISNMLFFDRYIPTGCYETYPIEGGECWKVVRCDPPEPEFMGQLVNVGAVSLSSTFDTIERAPSIFQAPETRDGPFWRGDGDSVRFAFAGTEGAVPPFEYTARAPVGDAVAVVPKRIARTEPLRLSWRYAIGDQPAVGQLTVGLNQFEPTQAFLSCRVPMAQRAIEIPATLLSRFSAGQGTLAMASTTSGAINDEVVKDAVRIVLSVTSTVDIGNPDSDPNVVFE